jgi:hypothetical protein
MSNFIGLIEELTTATMQCSTLRSTMSRALSSDVLQGKLWSFVQDNPDKEGVSCCTHAASLQRQLISANTALLLHIALAAGPGGGSTLPQALTAALINKQRRLPATTGNCQCTYFLDTSRQTPISLFQQASTQYTDQHLQDWSKRLNLELESQR